MKWAFLIPIAWALWGLELLGLLYGLVDVTRNPGNSPEAGPGLGIFAVGLLLVVLLGAGALLYWFQTKQWPGAVLTMVLVLAYPAVFLVADPMMRAAKKRNFEQEIARVGKFREPLLQQMGQAIRANDSAGLKQLLNGQPPPAGTDLAGNDLLTFSLLSLGERGGDLSCTRTLLEAGADPRQSPPINGLTLVHWMIFDTAPNAQEAVALLLKHGADPNVVAGSSDTAIRSAGDHPETVRALVEAGANIDRIGPDGITDVIYLTSTHKWESATYLVEKGARLDVSNEHGLSLDYYLNDWKDSVFGDHPEGWDKLRAAIAKRRAAAGQ